MAVPGQAALLLAEATGSGLGGTDCESIHEGWAAQPVNTVTSVAYIAVGISVLVRARRAGFTLSGELSELGPTRVGREPLATAAPWFAGLYGLAVVAEGVGSILFHGPQTAGARWLHDWAIVAIIGMIAIVDWAVLTRRPVPGASVVFLLLGGTGLGMALLPTAGVVASGVIVAAAVVGEVLVVARGQRLRGRTGIDGPWSLLLPASMMALALLAYALGRTGAPLCDPDSALQLHGLWHILTALTFGWWARVALFEPHTTQVMR